MKKAKPIIFDKIAVQSVLPSSVRENELLKSYEYFLLKYNQLPNYLNLRNLSKKAFEYFLDWPCLQRSTFLENSGKGKRKLTKAYGGILGRLFHNNSDYDQTDTFSFVKDDLFVGVERSDVRTDSFSITIAYLEKDEKEVEKLANILLEFSLELEQKVKFAILVKECGDAVLRDFEIKVPENLDLSLNYGKDFLNVNNLILKYLKDHTKGLYLYHGDPGTGKSTYIKYLASQFPDYKFIYVPEMLVTNLNSPEFLSLLLGTHKKQVIVIEDSEKFIRDRNKGDFNVVSTILNISDGILSDIINVPIIMTYNMKDEKIDEALLRKGRLKFSYEFKPLSVEDAQKLADHLKLDTKIKEPTTLADIYNFQNTNMVESELKKKAKPTSIGFSSVEPQKEEAKV